MVPGAPCRRQQGCIQSQGLFLSVALQKDLPCSQWKEQKTKPLRFHPDGTAGPIEQKARRRPSQQITQSVSGKENLNRSTKLGP